MDNIGFFLFCIVALGIFLVAIAGMWKVFEKAGQPGWACIVPIFNVITLMRIAGKPDVWFLFMFIPVVNFVIAIIVAIEIAKKFGQGTGFGVGLALLPVFFYPILGFGQARYLGAMTMQRSA